MHDNNDDDSNLFGVDVDYANNDIIINTIQTMDSAASSPLMMPTHKGVMHITPKTTTRVTYVSYVKEGLFGAKKFVRENEMEFSNCPKSVCKNFQHELKIDDAHQEKQWESQKKRIVLTLNNQGNNVLYCTRPLSKILAGSPATRRRFFRKLKQSSAELTKDGTIQARIKSFFRSK